MFDLLRMFAPLVGRVPLGHLVYLWRRLRDEHPHRVAGQIRINSFFPPWPSPAFDRFVETVVHRRRVPVNVYLAPTARCPERCDHCSVARRERRPERLTADWLDVIDQVKSLGTSILGITGGEPLLRDDLPDLLAAAKPEMTTVVFTTGAGLDADRARAIAQAGCDNVTVSVEFAEPAAHDAARRRAGSFDDARRAVAACRAAGLYVALSTIATRERLAAGELDRLYELAADWDAGEIRILSPVATGRRAGDDGFMLTPDELAAVTRFHLECNRAARRKGGPVVAAFAYLESPALFGCGGGYHHLYIDPAGEVCPCDLTPASFGNAFERPLSDIWSEMARTFGRPRRRCLMADLAETLTPETPLPLSPADSTARIPTPDGDLPKAYRRLL